MDRIPIWQMIKEAVNGKDGVITNAQIKDYIRTKYGDVNPQSINCQIIICSVNKGSRTSFPENHKPRVADPEKSNYDFLYNIGWGKVTNYNPEIHGNWAIELNNEGKCSVVKYK